MILLLPKFCARKTFFQRRTMTNQQAEDWQLYFSQLDLIILEDKIE